MKTINSALKGGRYTTVWMDLPRHGAVQRNLWRRTLMQFSIWIRTAKHAGIHCVLCGPEGRRWQDEHLISLIDDKIVYESSCATCYFGEQVIPEPYRPNGLRYKLFSTVAAESIECRCPAGSTHKYGLSSPAPGRAEQRLQVQARLYERLIPRLMSQSRRSIRPDSINLVNDRDGTNAIDKQQAFPTESREAEKERHRAGIKPVKRKQIVEAADDDLGDSLNGLDGDVEAHFADVLPEEISDSDESYDGQDDDMITWWFTQTAGFPNVPSTVFIVNSFEGIFAALDHVGPGMDICEFCGGAARTTTVAIRRRLRAGQNFDLVTHLDLGEPPVQRMAIRYLDTNNVLVLIMAPRCRSLGPPSNVNYAINYDTLLQHFEEDKPHLSFCGYAALHQLKKGRHFFSEQPHPTWLWYVEPWPHVGQHPSVGTQIVDMCTMGLLGPNKLPAQKRSELTAGAPELLDPFRGMRCNGRHKVHDTVWGSGQTEALQVWTWNFAERVIAGVSKLRHRVARQEKATAFPSVGIGPETEDDAPSEGAAASDQPAWMGCPGCRRHLARTHRSHNRQPGVCKYPDAEPEPEWTCPGCSRTPPRPRGHPDHTDVVGECRWAIAPQRRGHARMGAHPREARRPAASDPTEDLQERDLPQGTEAPAPGSRVLDPGGPGLPTPVPPLPASPSPGMDTDAARNGVSSLSSSSSRGPDREQRERRAQPRVLDAGTGEAESDWTQFDVSKHLRTLRIGTAAQIRRTLRKLHLRWWHAQRAPMERILSAAGVPTAVIQMILDIVDTCRECRAWKRPGPDPTPSLQLATAQNELVEADILFFKTYMVWHMLDRADRWHAGQRIVNKTMDTLITAIMTTWLQIFGPIKFLIIDGEKSIFATEGQARLKSMGIEVRPRAPEQHARFLERRGAILRFCLHCMESQLEREGIPVQFEQLLAEGIFARNALISHGGATPYNARLGTQPAMLPGLHVPADDPAKGAGRCLQRIREISLQKIIEATALDRMHRADRSKTLPAGEGLDYQPGEDAEFYNPPASKDVSGWHGPAPVIENLPDRGQVKLRWKGQELLRKYADVRRFMAFIALTIGIAMSSDTALGGALATVLTYIDHQPERKLQTFGYMQVQGVASHARHWQLQTSRVSLGLHSTPFVRHD